MGGCGCKHPEAAGGGCSCKPPEEHVKRDSASQTSAEEARACPMFAEDIVGVGEKLTVTIVGATGLRASHWVPGPERPYCICTLWVGETELVCTKAIKDALEPRWQEHSVIMGLDRKAELRFEVMDVEQASPRAAERGSRDVLLSATLAGEQYNECGFTGDLSLKQPEDGLVPSLRVKVRLGDDDYPEPPPMEVTIKVARNPKDKLGLDLHLGDATARVASVQEGPFLPSRLPEGVVLHPGDFIVSVNGVRGNPQDLVSTMQAERSLSVTVRKPVEFVALMDAQQVGHGLDLSKMMVHNCLLVKSVRKGAFQNWNLSNPKQVSVNPGDRVLAVSGERGSAEDLLGALLDVVGRNGICQVTFVRPADPESTWWLY